MKIGIVDVVGLVYNGDTVYTRGLGGSESAVIYMAEELVKLGHEATIHNDCNDSETKSGIFAGVNYVSHDEYQLLTNPMEYDIVISVRSVKPFFADNMYASLMHRSKHKILWMHDTFCEGDEFIEDMLNRNFINEVFTLSDFHTNYILNCRHGDKRNFEVLKSKVFQTRNGIRKWKNEIHLDTKNPYGFVYNASATKGMVPLLEMVWPEVRKQIPLATLDIIGGFYRFRADALPDEQEKTVRKFMRGGVPGVTFHGVISQKEVADIVSNATFMIYPPAFPETFGISTMESIFYKTPVITSNFGALEETAIDMACYKMNYAIEPNGLFPNINKDNQVREFVSLVLDAYNDKYLLQQKQQYCGVIDDICTWDMVALQWDQHFHEVMDMPFPVEKYRKVKRINDKVKRVFGRTFDSTPYFFTKSRKEDNKFVFVSPTRNSVNYSKRHVESILAQDYDNYQAYLIDDMSNDGTGELLKEYASDNIFVKSRKRHNGAILNQIDTINRMTYSEDYSAIIVLLDGDDWLINDPHVLDYLNDIYSTGVDMTYGSMWSLADSIPLISQEYPKEVIANKSYESYKFNWGIPYTHLRTFRKRIFEKVDLNKMKYDGNWMMSGADNPLFYELIKASDKHYCNKEVICVYNDINPLNDFRINAVEQNRNAGVLK